MSAPTPDLHDLFADAFARYLTVRPGGLQMPHGPIVPSLRVRLLVCRPARTLYENHQPRCRSLDGIQSIASVSNVSRNAANAQNRACASCMLRGNCTPQIFLELLHERVPYRLLLAYTSARNFILFVSRLRKHGQPVENSDVLISVLDRGRWGEVRFSTPQSPSRA